MEKILRRMIEQFNISNVNQNANDAAFELLACTVAFDKSPFNIINESWNHKIKNNKIFLDGEDGKLMDIV